ncbi:MAG TPA: hypothetical protein VGD02_07925 [Gemmatimonadaceae bacterium]|jgi:hypothetical protein
MQIPAQTPDIAPPATPLAPRTIVISQDGKPITITVPRTRAEIAALISQRNALSDQLESVSDRRRNLSEELAGTPDEVARKGLEDRIQVLDRRILQLESDLDATGRQLSSAAPTMVATTEEGMTPPDRGDEFPQGMAVGGASVLGFCALVYFLSRRRARRQASRARPVGLTDDSGQRLERLEHGMEAIAIEIERISEGQRFVTKLLSQSEPVPSMSNQAGPLAVEQKSIKG